VIVKLWYLWLLASNRLSESQMRQEDGSICRSGVAVPISEICFVPSLTLSVCFVDMVVSTAATRYLHSSSTASNESYSLPK
jgi:hypothetical protein